MTLSYKGIKIKYQCSGKGKPIVFLHGFLENSEMWDSIISELPELRCIAIDLLGHGETGNLGYVHTMKEMADCVMTVLNSLEVRSAIFVGHSMGGYVSLEIVNNYKNLVDGLLLLNSTSFPDSEERKFSRERAIDIVKKNPNAYTSMAIANLFAPENRLTFDVEIQKIKIEASKTTLQGIISALEGMKVREDHLQTLKSFRKHKIIFAGTKDPVLDFSQSQEESELSQTELISFDGGHMTYLENSVEFLTKLKAFISEVNVMRQ